ncbi:MAG: hypothetical protein N2490_02365 [Ignavibacteria bacterium]|nr:hypothetical protein [Ignavibacteria bacterium]
MKRNIIFWIIAFVLTVLISYFQRITGPTYPVKGSTIFQGKQISYEFIRSYSTNLDCPVIIQVPDSTYKATLLWKRHKTRDEREKIQMKLFKDTIVDSDLPKTKQMNGYFYYTKLPKQPPAGKLEYFLRLETNNSEKNIPEEGPVIIRYKGDVPTFYLFLHIVIIFASFTVGIRTGLEYFNKEPKFKKFVFWTIGLLFLGGFILGPIIQKFAFGEYWTGFPFGFDLTDNKILISFIGWIASAIALYRSKKPERWILGAVILMIIVFLIPHSLLGSELDWSKNS